MNFFYKPVIFCLFILVGVNQNSKAQNESLRFEHIGIEEGLLNEKITAILQDSKGFLWFGTFDGLFKYDAYSFTRYQFDPFDQNSLSANFIYSIFEDKYDTIWVSTFEGLCKFDRSTEKFTRYKPSPNARFFNPNISAINEDSEGMIWVGSTSGGLCRFDRQTGRFVEEYIDPGDDLQKADSVPKGGISCIYKDPSGTLWVGNNTGLHQINLIPKTGQRSEVRIRNYLSGNRVGPVKEDQAGILWIGTNNGLHSFDRETGIFKSYQNDPKNIHSISSNDLGIWFGNTIDEDQEGNLWIATGKGLNKLNRDRTVFTSYFHNANDPYSLSSDKIYCLKIDKAGILWAGPFGKELNKVNLNKKAFGIRQHDPNNVKNSLSNNQVTAIVEDSAGIVWIGTYGGGLNRWDKRTNQFIHLRRDPANPKSLKSDSITAILEDRHGHLWIGNGNVLSKLNKRTSEFTHYLESTANFEVFSITEDQQGLIWIGTGNGIRSFDEKTHELDTWYYDPKKPEGISDNTAVAIFADSKDNIWIGYGSRGTDKYNKKTKSFSHYTHDPSDSGSISSNLVQSFYEDSKGNLWLGSWAGGLSHFDYEKENFKTFTNKHGLASTTIFSIAEDNSGQLWLGTRNGLSRFNPATKKFTNYDFKDGLQGNIFSAGARERGARFKGRDGTLYFGGTGGFNFFNPAELKASSHIAPIVITQFKLFDNSVKGDHESTQIVLDYDENYFSFEFSSLSFSNPAKNQYAYKLEGVDNDWVYSGSRRYVAYTNIDPGTYTFKVKGTNSDGIWNEQVTYMTVIINPPWYRTWWAYILYILLFAGLIYAFIRYRINKIRMQAEIVVQKHKAIELEMQALRAQMNPHFIFNSLNSINRFILQNNKAQASEYLTKFSKLVRMILQNSQASLITLESELESLELYLNLEAVRFNDHFDYKISVPKDLDISVMKVPPLILQPYVENAIWHGLMHKEEKGHLDVEVSEENDHLYFKISDDGIGREKAAALASKSATKHKSMGLRITADRIAILRKSQTFTSPVAINDLVDTDGNAAGTEVTIKIPVLYE